METQSNTKLLKQYPKRERPSKGKKFDAVKAGAKGNQQEQDEKPTRKTVFPGATYIKALASSSALSMIAFGVAAIVIVKYGDKMAEYVES